MAMELASTSKPTLPVLVVPGIVCSPLRVEKSQACPSWEGQRIWVPAFSKVVLSAAKAKDTWDEEDELPQNMVLQHFIMKGPEEEAEGIRVRAIEGSLAGLNLFDEGVRRVEHPSFTHANLYVQLVNALRKFGYEDGHGIECAAYDWRLAPGVMQSRDDYFERLAAQVERMSAQSTVGRGVVLLGHSMGNKILEYFFAFAKKTRGQAWLDRHVYSWMIVGGPLLGAAYTARMAVSGDCPYPGMEAVFSKDELLVLFRSLSSLPCLFPSGVHADQQFYVRRQGALEIQNLRANVEGLGISRHNKVKVAIIVQWGRLKPEDLLLSASAVSFDGSIAAFEVDDLMRFGGPASLPADAKIFAVVYEKGTSDTATLAPNVCSCCAVCCLPCAVCRATRILLSRTVRALCFYVKSAAGAVTHHTYAGQARARSRGPKLGSMLGWRGRRGEFVHVRLPLIGGHGEVTFEARWQDAAQLQAAWMGPDFRPDRFEADTPPSFCDRLRTFLSRGDWRGHQQGPVRNKFSREVYDRMTLAQLLKMSEDPLFKFVGTERVRDVWQKYYRDDPLFNTKGNDDAPPVRRVVNAFGCNVATEVSCVLRLNTYRSSKRSRARTRFVPDEEAELVPDSDLARRCSLVAGVLREEPRPGHFAGDGTVPFCSLGHPRSWADRVEYKEHLLEKSPHTMNMVDPRFPKLVIQNLVPE